MNSELSPPATCPICHPRNEFPARRDVNNRPKPAATGSTKSGSALNTESPRPKSFKPFRLSYTCGCVVHAANPPWICPTCWGGVMDVHSLVDGSSLKQSGPKEPPAPQSSPVPPGQEQRDDDSRILSVWMTDKITSGVPSKALHASPKEPWLAKQPMPR